MRIREDSRGQLLAFYVERPSAFTCFVCSREIHSRAKNTHATSKEHMRNQSRTSAPVHTRKRARLTRKENTPSYMIANDDDALDAYYEQCAREDGTYDAIRKEYGL